MNDDLDGNLDDDDILDNEDDDYADEDFKKKLIVNNSPLTARGLREIGERVASTPNPAMSVYVDRARLYAVLEQLIELEVIEEKWKGRTVFKIRSDGHEELFPTKDAAIDALFSYT